MAKDILSTGYLKIASDLSHAVLHLLHEDRSHAHDDYPELETISAWAREVVLLQKEPDQKALLDLKTLQDAPANIRKQILVALHRHLADLVLANQPEQAEHLANRIRQAWSEHTGVEEVLGRALYRQGNEQKAIEWFHRTRDLSKARPVNQLAYRLLANENNYPAPPLPPPTDSVLQEYDGETPDDALASILIHALFTPAPQILSGIEIVLAKYPKTTFSPRIPALTHPFFRRLMQRVESPTASTADKQMAAILAEAMTIENTHTPYHETACLFLMRFLLSANRPRDAYHLIEQETEANPTFRYGFTHLTLFAWVFGQTDLAAQARKKMIPHANASAKEQFANWVTFAILHDFAQATEAMNTLFKRTPHFFTQNNGVTIWGMLALALKSMGHPDKASRANLLAGKLDPLHASRAHLLDRIQPGAMGLPLAPFPWPDTL